MQKSIHGDLKMRGLATVLAVLACAGSAAGAEPPSPPIPPAKSLEAAAQADTQGVQASGVVGGTVEAAAAQPTPEELAAAGVAVQGVRASHTAPAQDMAVPLPPIPSGKEVKATAQVDAQGVQASGVVGNAVQAMGISTVESLEAAGVKVR